jgi:hypothetical protein
MIERDTPMGLIVANQSSSMISGKCYVSLRPENETMQDKTTCFKQGDDGGRLFVRVLKIRLFEMCMTHYLDLERIEAQGAANILARKG